MNLRIILERYPLCLESRAKLSAILRDLYPSERREINIVLDIYESGIADKIKHLKSIDGLQVQAFCQQLENDYALSQDYALLGLSFWLEAYHVTLLQVPSARKTSIKNNHPVETSSGGSVESQDISLFPARSIYAHDTNSGYELKILTLATAEIISYKGHSSRKLIIPSIIDGKHIIGIGKDVFRDCMWIESVIISEGIRYINDGAFAGCKKLKSCILPHSLVRLGTEYDTLSRSVGVFENSSIKSIYLPDGIQFIEQHAFRNCQNLK